MHRRTFLKSAIALAAAAGLPSLDLMAEEQMPEWLREFQRTGELRNQTIELHNTLHIDSRFAGCCIRNCVFNLSRRFPRGNPAIRVDPEMTGLIANVDINDTHGRLGTVFEFNFKPTPVDW